MPRIAHGLSLLGCEPADLDPGTRCRGGYRGRAADGGAAQDGVGVVEDGGLAFGYAAGGVVQAQAEVAVIQPGGTGVDLAVGAELDQAVDGFGGRGAAGSAKEGGTKARCR